MPSAIRSPEDTAIKFTSQSCFHQSVFLPATAHHDRLRVTFATTSNAEQDIPAVLYCHPMGAGRLLVFDFEHLARQAGVRIIFIDRPGFGGSTPVQLEQRVNVWLESVITVLGKLGIQHVSLISHSAGTVYLFNTLLSLPQVLHASAPYAAVQAPWVHPSHSSAPVMGIVDRLPASWIGKFHHIQGFVRQSVIPPIQFSSGLLGSMSKLSETDDAECRRIYGVDKVIWDQITRLQGRYFGLEDSSGISQEALLCMRKGERLWGVCNDLPSSISAIHHQYSDHTHKLRLHAFFSETDLMIGKGGQAYFEKCWEEGNGEGAIEFCSELVPGTNHETLLLPYKECFGKILEEIRGLSV